MELRSGRSRSNTPFLSNSFDNDVVITGNHVEKVSKTKSTTIKTYENIVSTESKHVKSKATRSQKGIYKTSDYSSEEEHEISSPSRHISDNLKNQLREQTLYSANAKENVSALKVYKDAGDYWNKYPKTDYTYSKHSKDRIELAPGVVAMPNMSRRSLHTYSAAQDRYSLNKQTNTDSYLEQDSSEYVGTTNGSSVRHRFSSSHNNQDEEEEEFIIRRRIRQRTVIQRVFQVFISIFTTIFYPVYYIYDKQYSLLLLLAKKLHKIASRLMLFDTWLLQGQSSDRKISTILGLCLLPLILFGGWWLTCGLGQLVQGTLFNTPIYPMQVPIMEAITSSLMTESINEAIHNDDALIGDDNKLINELRKKINLVQKELVHSESNRHSNSLSFNNAINDIMIKIDLIRKQLAESEENRKNDLIELEARREEDKAAIMAEINERHAKSFIQMEEYVFKFLKEVFGAPSNVLTQHDFSRWIQLIFVAQQDLDARLIKLTKTIKVDFTAIIENNEKLLMDKVTAKILEAHIELSKSSDGAATTINFSDEHIKKLVGEALAVYDADKTGLVDFALESAGGHIISTRCTESYQVKSAILSIFGIPVYYPTNSPRTAITPGVNPGECWAFQSFPGFLVIKLSSRISVEAFTVEHISKRISTTGKIDSAMKQFEVYGLMNETDPDLILLGTYEYKDNGRSLQYFEVQKKGQIFDMIELRILSNHGNPNYTCLYRFRVHGTLSQEPT